jgi:hypothetical protein
VTVFAVEEVAHLHFFVMQFIPGRSSTGSFAPANGCHRPSGHHHQAAAGVVMPTSTA